MAPPLLRTRVVVMALASLPAVLAAPPPESAAPIPVPDALRAGARAVPDAVMKRLHDAV